MLMLIFGNLMKFLFCSVCIVVIGWRLIMRSIMLMVVLLLLVICLV